MSVSPRVGPGSSSPCKGEDRWGSTASRFTRTPGATTRARRLRRNATEPEKRLWRLLQRRQMSGFSFRRQHPIGKYVVDFYCAALNLVIELDGGQHNEPRHQDRDAHRTMWLKAKGVTVLRFWNNDVMGNIEGIWDEIARHAAELGARPATPSLTLPLSGGGNYPGEVDR